MYIVELISLMKEINGSDMYLVNNYPPAIKIGGKLEKTNKKELTGEEIESIALDLIGLSYKESEYTELTLKKTDRYITFKSTNELNFGVEIVGIGNCRVNLSIQRGEVSIVIRLIGDKILSVDELKVPEIMKQIVLEKRGLIIVAGGTGSGKSTSLAAMVKYRIENTYGHIITIEDPIEFFHSHGKSLVTQREVGVDTKSWHAALKNTLRQAPDVILIGEIRDRETMEQALAIAETGHLVLCTLHANNANQTIDRVVNFFTESERKKVLSDLSLNLRAVISQRLVPRSGGGRIPAVEVLLNKGIVTKLIKEGASNEIKETLNGKGHAYGMCSFDNALLDLFIKKEITIETALAYADSSSDLSLEIELKTGVNENKEGVMNVGI